MEQIYIGHSVFELEHAAKEKLESYLKDLKEYIVSHEIGVDVYEDIESRIEERMSSIKTGWDIVESDIDTLIFEIGKAEEIFATDSARKGFAIPKFREIYRNPRKGKFLGVCYGIGKALGIEPIWIRLLCIVLFFGMPFFAVIAYVIAALIMKEEPESQWSTTSGDIPADRYAKVENGIRRFFDMLYKFGEKIINALK